MTITLAAASIVLFLQFATSDQPFVDEDPFHEDSVVVWDEDVAAPKVPPPPQWAVEPAPPTYEPEPFFCRPEAPFPNDECIPPPEPSEPEDDPELTPGDVEREVKRVGLPRLRVSVQPAGATLVNLETIFHTTAAPFERTVDILDSTVDLRAVPATYTWHHGDGTTQTTTTPGRPYPAMDVIHQYNKPGHVTPRVDVTYRVTYRIDDGDWQALDTTITAPGPATALRIREARPVLTD